MEHRCEQRIPMDLTAQMYKHGAQVACGRIKNGGNHGLFLETGYRDIRELQHLDLEIVLDEGFERKRYELKTVVVRKNYFGLGLELEVLSEVGVGNLLDLVAGATIRPGFQEMSPVHAQR